MGRCRLGHTKTFRVQQGKGRHGARAGLARGFWLLLVIVLATPRADLSSVSAGEAPRPRGLYPRSPLRYGSRSDRCGYRHLILPLGKTTARGFTRCTPLSLCSAVAGRARYRCARMMRRYGMALAAQELDESGGDTER